MINNAKLRLRVTRMMHENEADRRLKLDVSKTMLIAEIRTHFIYFQHVLHFEFWLFWHIKHFLSLEFP